MPGGSNTLTASQSSVVGGQGGSVNISVDPPPVDVAALTEKLTAVAVAVIQWDEIKRHNRQLEQDARDARQFLDDQRDEYRVESIGGPGLEARLQGVYINQYIPALEARGDYNALIARANTIRAALDPALNNTDALINDLFDLDLKNERLNNLAVLRTEQIVDKATERTARENAITAINDSAIDLARAKESAINLAFKEEVSRIETEEGRRGYIGGDCLRDMRLLTERLKLQDNIAINFSQTDLDNTTRLETLREQISREEFDLSESNRGARFEIVEDDVNKRLLGIDLPARKIVQNQNVKEDAPEDLAGRSWVRRYERKPFAHEEGPVGTTIQASRVLGDSPFAVAASAIGGLTQQALRGGFSLGRRGSSSTAQTLGTSA